MRLLRVLVIGCVMAAAVVGQGSLAVEGLPDNAPLTVKATATTDGLTVHVAMRSGWHLYARDVGGGRPVAVTLESGAASARSLVLPPDEDGKLKGSFDLVLPLKGAAAGAPVVARFDFMACDPLMCMPPMTVSLKGQVGAASGSLKVLLVADVRDDHSARVAAFLGAHGFTPTVTTYGEVTTSLCDAHDVVVADSKLFGKYERGALPSVRGFPRTTTPIVAVGFFGTELVEGQGLAMTSGYI